MKNKNFISLSVSLAFLLLATTGILLYVKQKAHFIEMTHTIFGLLFVGFAVFHIANNWSSLKAYSKERKSGSVQKEFIYAALLTSVILILSVTEVLEPVAEFGRIFVTSKKRPESVQFQEKTTLDSIVGKEIVLIMQKKKEFAGASLAVDVVDTLGKVVTRLYDSTPADGQPADLILTTKIAMAAPFYLLVHATKEGKLTDVKTRIDRLDAGNYPLAMGKESPLKRFYLEIN